LTRQLQGYRQCGQRQGRGLVLLATSRINTEDSITGAVYVNNASAYRPIGGHCKHQPDARTHCRKNWSRTLKTKLRCRRNVVDKYQVSRKCTTRL